MTKRDGDRLRTMRAELIAMSDNYPPGYGTSRALIYLANEVELALRGHRDRPKSAETSHQAHT